MTTTIKMRILLLTFYFTIFCNLTFAQSNDSKEYSLIIKTFITGTNSSVKSTLGLKDISTKSGFQGKGQTTADGIFSFKLNQGAVLEIKVESEGYMPTTVIIDPKKSDLTTNPIIRIEITKIEVGTLIKLENVSFDKGEFELLPQSYIVLNDLVTLLRNNPKMKIELAGHTDAIGGTQTNLKLSQDRVESVKKYLIEKGIKQNRIKGVGYGGKRPIAKNDTEEGRELNRRVEFKVLKID